jgi:hypothetical protein
MVYKNKNTTTKYIIIVLVFFLLLVFFTIYWFIFRVASYKIHEGQNIKWMSDLTDVMILGLNDRKLYSKIDRDGKNITFWYVYWFFNTKHETIWILIHLRNKFSSSVAFNIYNYNHETKQTTNEIIDINMEYIQTIKENNTLIIKIKDIYIQTINLIESKSTLSINTQKFKIFLNLSITDCNTNMSNFVPRIKNVLGNIIDIKGTQTYTPNEWFSDNPYIGKIINGTINGNEINKGNYWFDNFIACNNGFLTTYTWFVIMNDDWLIYLLWFGDQTDKNKGFLKPFIIKNIKENKMIYSGIIGYMNDPFSPVSKMDFTTNKNIGVDDYDDYTIIFESTEIDIYIKSKNNGCKKVYEFDYYKSNYADKNVHIFNDWDKEYYKILRNIKYVEYITLVDVEINYNNKVERFTADQIIDAMYRIDSNIPRTINYK